jgi:hypothetical protein
MKLKIIAAYLLTLTLLLFGGDVSAEPIVTTRVTPKYTDKETALRLAKVLDKGTFGRHTISSAYVQNDSISEYYISVILSDGSAQKWYIDQIYKWSRDDELLLDGNRVLLFLDPTDSHFAVLEKNRFHRMALNANIYIKVFTGDDPLAGQRFRFFIKSFSLIAPTETAFGRDANGSKYRYIIDLFNGLREFLTYEDVYSILEKGYLLNEDPPSAPTLKNAYWVTKIVPHSKGPAEDGVSQFGVEIEFNQPILMEGTHIPYVIHQQRQSGTQPSGRMDFFIDFTIPNSEKRFEIRPIDNLEYLHDIRIINDPRFPNRLLLRARFNPTFIDIPPVAYKNSENSIYINFFNLVDQTILSRGMLLEAKQRKAAEEESAKQIKVTKAIKEESDYTRAFIVAMETQKEAQTIRDPLERINKLLIGIKQFEQAALYAEKDVELSNALSKRNELQEIIIGLSLDYVKTRMSKEDINPAAAQQMIALLDQAESFTRRPQILKDIEEFRIKLSSY